MVTGAAPAAPPPPPEDDEGAAGRGAGSAPSPRAPLRLPRLMILLNMADWEAGGGGSDDRSANNSFLFPRGIWGFGCEREGGGCGGQVAGRKREVRWGQPVRCGDDGRGGAMVRLACGMEGDGERRVSMRKERGRLRRNVEFFLFTFFSACMKFVFMGGVYLLFCELFDIFSSQWLDWPFL
jgi:hypothetical protein